jgi:hypothetical protein
MEYIELTFPFLQIFMLEDEVLEIMSRPAMKDQFVRSRYIDAIKHVRDTTGWLLVDSKNYVDKIRHTYGCDIQSLNND